jgi:hypothetical protein
MLRTGQLLGPASHPASRPRTGALLPGTLASPRTGLTPAGCPQLVDWLRHHNINLLVVMAPNLLDAPPLRREWGAPFGAMGIPLGGAIPPLSVRPLGSLLPTGP